MFDIIVKGLAGETYPDWVDKSEFDGIDCQDSFSEYFHEEWNIDGRHDENEQSLIDKGVKGGYMKFSYRDGKLYVIVKYRSNKKLDNHEIEVLKDYTQGQMSDGIGEGFEQNPCIYVNDAECFVSPWYHGQVLEVEQIER